MTYPKLSIEDFGRKLITGGDLDPIYYAFNKMTERHHWTTGRQAQWLVAYWCYYHAGVACFMSDLRADLFWSYMATAAKNAEPSPAGDRWPRAKERRHFRGVASENAVQWLRTRFPDPADMIDEAGSGPFAQVSERVQRWPLFGPWIAFKVGDMLERCLHRQVDFTEGEVFMFKDPTEAALMLWRQRMKLADDAKPKNKEVHAKVISGVVQYLRDQFSDLTAPPEHSRPLGVQEIETVLCKWKSHMRGHYPINNDLVEISDGLAPWAHVNQTAQQFLNAMPLERS